MGVKRVIYGLPVLKAYRDHQTRQLAERHADHFAGFRFAGTAAFLNPAWERKERALIDAQIAAADELMMRHGYVCTHAQTGEAVSLDQARLWARAEVGRSNYLFRPA